MNAPRGRPSKQAMLRAIPLGIDAKSSADLLRLASVCGFVRFPSGQHTDALDASRYHVWLIWSRDETEQPERISSRLGRPDERFRKGASFTIYRLTDKGRARLQELLSSKDWSHA